MIKKTITMLFIACLSTSAFAQFSLGAQFSYVKFFGGSEVKNSGLGLQGQYGLSEDKVVYGGFNLYKAYEQKGSFSAQASSNQTSPSTIDVDFTNKIPLTNVYIGFKKYFVGEYDDENFGFYGLLEMGYMGSKYTYDLDDYDDVAYNLTVEDETVSNFMITLGTGIEKGFDFGYLFSDLKLNIPANQENGEAVEVEIPASFSFNLGYRKMF